MLFSRLKLNELQQGIGITIRDVMLLEQAFVHRSLLNENSRPSIESNERLEFLGDKVLGIVLAHYLYRILPDAPEGKMTSIFGVMASAQMLSKAAEDLGLAEFVLLGEGEKKDFDARKRSRLVIMANTLEALVGAIYLDRGMGTAEIFLDSCLLPRLKEVIAKQQYLDPKGFFQDLAQKHLKISPRYEALSEDGPAHQKVFAVQVFLGGRCVGQGGGPTKQLAEVEAAKDALKREFQVTLS